MVAQLVEKCKAVKEINFQEQQKVKNQEETWSEISCVSQRNAVPNQIVQLPQNFTCKSAKCKKCRPRSFQSFFFRN